MKLAAPYKCDAPGCGRLKGEGNHWWMVAIDKHFVVFKWDDTMKDSPEVQHVCSQDCVSRMLSAWMNPPQSAIPEST